MCPHTWRIYMLCEWQRQVSSHALILQNIGLEFDSGIKLRSGKMRGLRAAACWKGRLLNARWCSNCAAAPIPLDVPSRDGNLLYLRNVVNGAELYLVGTMHVSQKSVNDVKEVINLVKPNVVAVELCHSRAFQIFESEDKPRQGLLRDFWDCPGNFGEKALHVFLQFFYQLVRNAGIEPAKEFKVAVTEGMRHGAEILLIDQDVNVTRAKLSKSMTMRDAFKLMKKLRTTKESDLIADAITKHDVNAIEKMNTREFARSVIKLLEGDFPELVQAILHERDEIMTERLLSSEGRIVGVVGLAHMDGIQHRWEEYQK